MTRPRILDLFCGAGGAAGGYHRAGFDIIGIDTAPQPHYPFQFHQADALIVLEDLLNGWPIGRLAAGPTLADITAIHASPVCKRWSSITRTAVDPHSHPDQIGPTRDLLVELGRPYVIENVPGAPLIDPIVLCGSMFDLDVRRHRLFETNWPLPDHHWPCRHKIWGPRFSPGRSDRKKNPNARARVVSVYGGGGGYGQRADDWRRAMGIDWMTRDELSQAIPPAYCEYIGTQLLHTLEATA